jgi:uncharacterized membrane protein YebE (DUF533 family)
MSLSLSTAAADPGGDMAFNAQGLLNQLLGAGQAAARNQAGGRSRQTGQSGLGGLMSQLGGGRGMGGGMGGLGGGAAAGALAMLLGGRRRRRMGGGLMRSGGAVALGMLAYRAYSEWQARQGAAEEPRTLDRVSGEEAEAQSRAVLKAVVAAAKADGHIDEQEHAAIEAELDKLGADPDLQAWLRREIAKPLDAAEVAAAGDTGVVASEMYLASRLVIDTENQMEWAYLDELARHLELDADLRARLDREAERATQAS